ncbi:MAG: HD domain-containing protein, partial [Candidatus Aenigmarchaeota archaeon]|nr:HD domain-containing protein [Candidatus Aenigmarchaeota archaeon]MDI6722265.1 HD domain-containing protein [Candidatus Aenigmarchaeota archaeon]
MKEKSLLKLMFELGVLSRMPRTGPYHVGITDHETCAAHSFRVMALAYFIAQEEKADTNKVLKMALVHDFPEARLMDQTFIQRKYYSAKEKEGKALSDQLGRLKGAEELKEIFDEFLKSGSKEADVVWDADILETLVEAKEYVQQGIKIMERWFLGKRKLLKTETGKRLFDILEKENI